MCATSKKPNEAASRKAGGEWVVIDSGFCLSRWASLSLGDGEQGTPPLPLKPKKAKQGNINSCPKSLLPHKVIIHQIWDVIITRWTIFYVPLRKQTHPRWGVEEGSPTWSWGIKRPRRYKPVLQKEMARRPWDWTAGGGTLLLRIWIISQYSGGFAFWIPATSVVQMLSGKDSKSWSQFGSVPGDQRDELSGRSRLQWRQSGASQFQMRLHKNMCIWEEKYRKLRPVRGAS